MKIKKIYILIGFLYLIIIVRLLFLMVVKNDYYQNLLNKKINTYIEISDKPRGRILDVNGNILVDNVGIKVIIYNKNSQIKLEEEINIAKELSKIIDLEEEINIDNLKDYWIITHYEEANKLITDEEYKLLKERKLTSKDIYNLKMSRITDEILDLVNKKEALIYTLMNTGYSYEPKIIKDSNVTEKEYALVSESNIKGLIATISYKRVYPYKNTLRSILGNVGSIPNEAKEKYLNLGYQVHDKVGISYLEKEYESYLKSTKSIYKVNSDNSLTLIKEGIKGNDLYLSIDINLVKKIEGVMKEEIIKAKKEKNTNFYNHSYVLVGNPNNGSVLALLGLKITNNGFIDITDKVISNSYTMGSSIKGASASVNYLYNLIKPGTIIKDACVKLFSVPNKCSFKSLGKIDDIKALAYSSNYYQYLTAIYLTGNKYTFNMKLNANKSHFDIYRNVFKSYGLGNLTGIDLPNEVVGMMGEKASDDLLLNLAIGQYDTYTPIEMLQYINTIANGMNRHKLSLMDRILDTKGHVILENKTKILNKILIDQESIKRIQEGFKNVFVYGTGRGNIDLKYLPAGKTGTSESFLDTDNDKKVDVATITKSLVAYFPYDNPKYSLVVISPNISYKNSGSSYNSNVNRYISKKVATILFEN